MTPYVIIVMCPSTTVEKAVLTIPTLADVKPLTLPLGISRTRILLPHTPERLVVVGGLPGSGNTETKVKALAKEAKGVSLKVSLRAKILAKAKGKSLQPLQANHLVVVGLPAVAK